MPARTPRRSAARRREAARVRAGALATARASSRVRWDEGAAGFLRERGYSDARIAKLVDDLHHRIDEHRTRGSRALNRRVIGFSRRPGINQIEYAALRVLAGQSTSAELWRLALDYHKRKQSDAQARGAKNDSRALIREVAELHFMDDPAHYTEPPGEPSITRSAILKRIRRGHPVPYFTTHRDGAGNINVERAEGMTPAQRAEADKQSRELARRAKAEAARFEDRTISAWIAEDCPRIPAPAHRPPKNK